MLSYELALRDFSTSPNKRDILFLPEGPKDVSFAHFSLHDWHIVEVEAAGPPNPQTGHALQVRTTRTNPALVGHVTGSATYGAFVTSMLREYM